MRASACPALAALAAAAALVVGCGGSPSPDMTGPPDGLPSSSAPLALDPRGGTLWVANPDAGSVTALDTRTLEPSTPVAVGEEPWSVAVTPAGAVVVANRAGGSLSVLHGGRRTDLAVGAEPAGVALSPTGRYAFVTLASEGAVAVVDLRPAEVVGRVSVGAMPWAIGVTDDGDPDDLDESVVVAHRLARLRPGGSEGEDDAKEAWVTRVPVRDAVAAARDDGGLPATAVTAVLEAYAFGYPNGVEGLALHGDDAYLAHLLNAPAYPRDFETTVSAAVSSVPIRGTGRAGGLRLHLNDETFSTPVNHPTAIALTGDGSVAYVTLGGTDAVMGIDLAASGGPELIGFWPTGANPRGLVLSPDGSRGYALNYLSRDVSVLDLHDRAGRTEAARVRVVSETLPAEELRGKTLFHNASSSRLSQLGWIACASCHLDGGSDGTTWLTPDGPRQTMPLWRLDGTAPFHASATRDEVQDFERDIEELMAGSGLAPGPYRPELGAPNGGLSRDLDALAAYVLNGIRTPRAPDVDEAAAAEGRRVYAQLGCRSCHAGPAWTVSALPGPAGSDAAGGGPSVTAALRDVGTFDPAADVLGAAGFDVPTLLGLHATAPYLHDGSAASLPEVLRGAGHVGRALSEAEVAALAEFLRSVDALTPPF